MRASRGWRLRLFNPNQRKTDTKKIQASMSRIGRMLWSRVLTACVVVAKLRPGRCVGGVNSGRTLRAKAECGLSLYLKGLGSALVPRRCWRALLTS